ncbi:hypothetical protein ZWY2020_048671 [Hordeum vulgare]|nr:hypothetical protein ZWY2020_048671 [Hordeum vulgare]
MAGRAHHEAIGEDGEQGTEQVKAKVRRGRGGPFRPERGGADPQRRRSMLEVVQGAHRRARAGSSGHEVTQLQQGSEPAGSAQSAPDPGNDDADNPREWSFYEVHGSDLARGSCSGTKRHRERGRYGRDRRRAQGRRKRKRWAWGTLDAGDPDGTQLAWQYDEENDRLYVNYPED